MRHLRAVLPLATLLATAMALGPVASASAASGPPPTSSRQVFGTVRLVEGIPGGAVDVYLNNRRVVSNLRPFTVTGPLRVAPGRYLVAVRRAGSAPTGRPLVRGQATVTGNQQVSLVAYVGRQQRLGVAEYRNLLAPTHAGQARLTLVNAAAVGPVDGHLDRFAFGKLASLQRAPDRAVPAGTHGLRIVKTGTGRTLVGPKRALLSAGYAYTGYLVGSGRTFALILQADNVGQEHLPELMVDLTVQVAVQVRLGVKVILQSIAPTSAPNPRVAAVHITAVPRGVNAQQQSATTRTGQRHP